MVLRALGLLARSSSCWGVVVHDLITGDVDLDLSPS